jgi:glycosyltransferase involved in cell wall biosynthesis
VSKLRICIDARMETGVLGGVEQVVIGLAHAFAGLDDGSEQYLFMTTPGKDAWLRPYMGGPCRIMHVGEPPPWALRRYKLRDLLSRRLRVVDRPLLPPPGPEHVMVSDGTVEQAGVDVVHFPCQMAFLTRIPSIYHPHDLQHLHLPEMFTEHDHFYRGLWYPAFSDQAALVVMMTEWGRSDLIENLDVPPRKVAVVPWGSVTEAYPDASPGDLEATRINLDLPADFLLYPSQTWPHKNHLGLLDALALVRDRHGEVPPVICPGYPNDEFQPVVETRARELDLESSIVFPGFVTPIQLASMYALARGLIFPSVFEGWGMPVVEAFSAGLPVASSFAAALSEVTAGAALLFDPEDPGAIADAVWRLWTDAELRADLADRGRRRASQLTFEHAARTFRAHYRRIAGRPLGPGDRQLIDASLPSEPANLESRAA